MPTDKPRFMVTVSQDVYQQIDEYRFFYKFRSQSQAINELIKRGLDSFRSLSDSDRSLILDPELSYIAKNYRDLDHHGRVAVRAVLDVETMRVSRESKSKATCEAENTYIKLLHFENPAAAGSPLDAGSDSSYIVRPATDVPDGSDFTVKLSGHSMEPDYPDGCTVFVRRSTDIEDGDVVIAWLAGDGSVCKRAIVRGERILKLESINRAYDDYSGAALEDMKVYGKVIGFTM